MEDRFVCPHCGTTAIEQPNKIQLGQNFKGLWNLLYRKCPACTQFIVELDFLKQKEDPGTNESAFEEPQRILIFPRVASRPPAPAEVPADYAKDFNEACLILTDSPNASGALSRRCLQNLIRHNFNIIKDNLFNEVEELLDRNVIPSYIKEDLHSLRTGGAVAVHPFKDKATSQILDMEPEEAEHLLDVLVALFDFCFVEPKKAEARRKAIEEKYKKKSK